MKKIGKVTLRETQVMSDVEMKNVIGGSGILPYEICEGKSVGEACLLFNGESGICIIQDSYNPSLKYCSNDYGANPHPIV